MGLCLGLAFLPLSLRRKARGVLLDLHAKLASLMPGAPTSGATQVVDDRTRLLEVEVTRLKRALVEARAASGLIEGKPELRLIPAEVLPLRGGADVVQRVALARGSNDGVRPGLPVLADGALVGRVANVTATTCEVLLATDPTFKIRATITRENGEVEGLVLGDGSDLLRFEPVVMNEAERGPVLKAGEIVISSRASVLCGVTAILGVVESIERPPGAGVDHALIRPTRDLGGLERVIIVRTGDGA